ncbi:MAG: hypothetical protein EBY80_12610, partial [Actinobacteria bacterium]|nr:hypothetical protein [Actinomycetota bacterium]
MANVRIGLAQLNPTVGDLAGNRALISDAYRRAVEAGCHIVAFPELSITGYPPEDLVLKPGFVRDNRAVLQELAAITNDCVAIIGFVDTGSGADTGTADAGCNLFTGVGCEDTGGGSDTGGGRPWIGPHEGR